MFLYALTIALSAFLLFAVQPIIAKMILPWFGGSSAVWSTCMLFFQLALLMGYLYAHWLHLKLRPRTQAVVHLALLGLSMAALPILPSTWWKTAGGPPTLRILALLAVTVGAPYFLLASTSPLLQAWYARTHKGGFPYRLFALSNLASMLALLSYPLVIEPNLATRWQGYSWSGMYIFFAIACAATAWRAAQGQSMAEASETVERAPVSPLGTRLLWLGLAAGASLLLLTTTNHRTQDVAAIPLLWILPLSVYLLTFIICFEAPRLYHRAVFLPLLPGALGFMAYTLTNKITELGMRHVIELLCASLFVCCMACHGELVRLKPDPRRLTGFYVTVSLGGAIGGIFVGLIAPNVFRAYYELPLSLAFCALCLGAIYAREAWRRGPVLKYAGVGILSIALIGYVGFLGRTMRNMVRGYALAERNFYGQLRVLNEGDPRVGTDASRTLTHGTINHGAQFLAEPYRRQPVTYFCPQTGVGRAMRASEGAPRRLGVIGLGCGTLAAYGRTGDTLRIYEINPLVVDIARRQFTYLEDSKAKVSVVMGDGRLSLEAEDSQQFDVLVLDVFSGDSVPVHVLTVEAFRTYFRHLKPGGMLAVNVTNRYLDLLPVMESAASAFGKVALEYSYEGADSDPFCFDCDWTLIMDKDTLDSHLGLARGGTLLTPYKGFKIWTDNFSNMYKILR